MSNNEENIWGDAIKDVTDKSGIRLQVFYSKKFHQYMLELTKDDKSRFAILDAVYDPTEGMDTRDWNQIQKRATELAKEIDEEEYYSSNTFLKFLETYGEPASQSMFGDYIVSLWYFEEKGEYLIHIQGENAVFIKDKISDSMRDPIGHIADVVERGIITLDEQRQQSNKKKKLVVKPTI
tara:strand:+ start:320 stop:859 length:540 start_codon:yes stop_codon:yes gene_type:complete